jgi:hypothetical protein
VLQIADSSALELGSAGSHEHNGREMRAREGTQDLGARQRYSVAERLLDDVGRNHFQGTSSRCGEAGG